MLLSTENRNITSDKADFIQTLPELFQNILNHGFLLLNATLVYRENRVREDAKYWQVFLKCYWQKSIKLTQILNWFFWATSPNKSTR